MSQYGEVFLKTPPFIMVQVEESIGLLIWIHNINPFAAVLAFQRLLYPGVAPEVQLQ